MNLLNETVTQELLAISRKLSTIEELKDFRLVGGTAIALQLGHRKSVDIDFFSNESFPKRELELVLRKHFGEHISVTKTIHSLLCFMDGVRVELYDSWGTPFLQAPVTIDGIRMATLEDLTNFKMEAIIERREKKDYIDLYFLFQKIKPDAAFSFHRKSNPYVSRRSILFAFNEVKTAMKNESPMPEMLKAVLADDIVKALRQVAKRQFGKDTGISL